jgi:hypothetical protein
VQYTFFHHFCLLIPQFPLFHLYPLFFSYSLISTANSPTLSLLTPWSSSTSHQIRTRRQLDTEQQIHTQHRQYSTDAQAPTYDRSLAANTSWTTLQSTAPSFQELRATGHHKFIQHTTHGFKQQGMDEKLPVLGAWISSLLLLLSLHMATWWPSASGANGARTRELQRRRDIQRTQKPVRNITTLKSQRGSPRASK